MSFTRSIGETGATTSVSENFYTAPVFIVELVSAGADYYPAAALTTLILILISSLLIFILRGAFVKKKRR